MVVDSVDRNSSEKLKPTLNGDGVVAKLSLLQHKFSHRNLLKCMYTENN